MKKSVCTLIILSAIIIFIVSCKNTSVKEGFKEVTSSSEVNPNLIVVAKDIITEVIVRPDTLGDPWDVEKVKNYNGKLMFASLFEDIYSKKITVYDNSTGSPLAPEDVRKIEKEFGSDISKIGKIQFFEDWYFNPLTNEIIKKVNSVTFAYELSGGEGLPIRYKALFKLNMEK
jgi:hypothetical protein